MWLYCSKRNWNQNGEHVFLVDRVCIQNDWATRVTSTTWWTWLEYTSICSNAPSSYMAYTVLLRSHHSLLRRSCNCSHSTQVCILIMCHLVTWLILFYFVVTTAYCGGLATVLTVPRFVSSSNYPFNMAIHLILLASISSRLYQWSVCYDVTSEHSEFYSVHVWNSALTFVQFITSPTAGPGQNPGWHFSGVFPQGRLAH